MKNILILLIILFPCSVFSSQTIIYKCKSKKNAVRYQDQPCKAKEQSQILDLTAIPIVLANTKKPIKEVDIAFAQKKELLNIEMKNRKEIAKLIADAAVLAASHLG